MHNTRSRTSELGSGIRTLFPRTDTQTHHSRALVTLYLAQVVEMIDFLAYFYFPFQHLYLRYTLAYVV